MNVEKDILKASGFSGEKNIPPKVISQWAITNNRY
jgi:hypothetical protein